VKYSLTEHQTVTISEYSYYDHYTAQYW